MITRLARSCNDGLSSAVVVVVAGVVVALQCAFGRICFTFGLIDVHFLWVAIAFVLACWT